MDLGFSQLESNDGSFLQAAGDSVKIGVISDTHISEQSDHLPGAILDAFMSADMVVHAGDMVSLEVIAQLEKVCPKVVGVSGNMDDAAVREKYPVKQILNISGFKIGIMHGWGPPLNLVDILKNAFKEDNCDIIIFGHSHEPMNETIGKTLFFNPGSATDKGAPCNSYGIIEINGKINARIIKI
ncbi:metallophosphoesterase [bacterium]|nr:MAG: metallophosphoesterase [bacterium]